MTVTVKICGLTDRAAVDQAVAAGADFIGFVFFPPSPRSLDPDQAAPLAEGAGGRCRRVGLFVDPSDDFLHLVLNRVPLDVIQLHGDEPPERVAEIRSRWNRPVMKALKIAEAGDLGQAGPYEPVADYFLFDAKPPKDATRPGGNANAFDWTLMTGRSWRRPWFLAGGLTPDNVASAIRISGASHVDASSGVEDAPGRKNPALIRSFIAAARKPIK